MHKYEYVKNIQYFSNKTLLDCLDTALLFLFSGPHYDIAPHVLIEDTLVERQIIIISYTTDLNLALPVCVKS